MLRKIAELKKSLSARFAGASVYTDGRGRYVVKMKSVFADMLRNANTDLAIVRGIIAEQEGVDASAITLDIESSDAVKQSVGDSIEDMFK